MNREKLENIYNELIMDIESVDQKMSKVTFPIKEDYKSTNFLIAYSCSKQYNVLSKVCTNIIDKLKRSNIKDKNTYIEMFAILGSSIPTYYFETLEICPAAENLKLKYIKFLNLEKLNLNTL